MGLGPVPCTVPAICPPAAALPSRPRRPWTSAAVRNGRYVPPPGLSTDSEALRGCQEALDGSTKHPSTAILFHATDTGTSFVPLQNERSEDPPSGRLSKRRPCTALGWHHWISAPPPRLASEAHSQRYLSLLRARIFGRSWRSPLQQPIRVGYGNFLRIKYVFENIEICWQPVEFLEFAGRDRCCVATIPHLS